MKVTYFFLLLVSAVFYIMYKGDLSFVLLAFMLLFPAVLLLILFLNVIRLKAVVYCEKPYTERGSTASVKINLHNRTPFPISTFVIELNYKSEMPFEKEKVKKYVLSASLGAGMNETVSLNFTPTHCGTFEISLKKLRVYDLLGLFHISKKISFSKKIIVQPRIFPIEASIESDTLFCSESNTFSPSKPGDDPSEILNLREYREGDRPNCIHWKLSSRNDNFIVKELSNPIASRILIITDFFGCSSADDTDRLLDASASLSAFLSQNGAAYSIAVPLNDYSIHNAEITDIDLFYTELNILSEKLRFVELKSGFPYIESVSGGNFISDSGFSRIIAVTAKITKGYIGELAQLCGDAHLSIICTDSSPENTENVKESLSAEIIYTDAEKLSTGIDGISI